MWYWLLCYTDSFVTLTVMSYLYLCHIISYIVLTVRSRWQLIYTVYKAGWQLSNTDYYVTLTVLSHWYLCHIISYIILTVIVTLAFMPRLLVLPSEPLPYLPDDAISSRLLLMWSMYWQGNPYSKGRLSTVDLLLLASLDHLLLIFQTLFTFYNTSYLNMGVNSTESFLLVSVPWIDSCQ